MRSAYADPPYLGMSHFYTHLHPAAKDYDDPETHRLLVERLVGEYPDGWALSASSTTLRVILPMCPEKTRVMAWCKRFAFLKPGVRVMYSWEPLLVHGGRKRVDGAAKTRDSVWCNPVGVRARERINSNPGEGKPEAFCFWVFDVLGAMDGDTLDDLFPGSGRVTKAWGDYMALAKRWTTTQKPPATSLFKEHQTDA